MTTRAYDDGMTGQGRGPDWFVSRRADSPVIVVAPHGGQRRRPIRRSDGMNDLHTADLALEVAERLDAHALVNRGCDRNDIDLNRIRQLVSKAPFFLRTLRTRVDEIVARGERPLVLLVHGWNMAVPWCDIGVGIRERGDLLYGRYPTVGKDRYESLIRPLAERLFDVGLGASIGLRYPAAGADNATQLFSGRHADHDHEDVAVLAARGGDGLVDAVQLELGIPLRWPGWRREAFLGALVDAVRTEAPVASAPQPTGTARRPHVRSTHWGLEAGPPRPTIEADAGCSIQAALDDGTGIFMGAEPTGAATMATRLCVALADGSMLLFVGEGPWNGRRGRYAVAGFDWKAESAVSGLEPSTVSVKLHGPLVHYRSHKAFVDLEKGLLDSVVAEAEIELDYSAVAGSYGRLRGRVRVGDTVNRRIDVWAICRSGGRRAAFNGNKLDVYMTGRSAMPRHIVDSSAADAAAVRVSFSGEGGVAASARLEVTRDCRTILDCATPVRVPVYRPLPDGRIVCVTFGTVRAADPDDSLDVGVYERVEIIDAAARPKP